MTSPNTRVAFIKTEWSLTPGQKTAEKGEGYSTEIQLKAFPSAPAFVFIAFLLLNPKRLTEAI